LTRGAACDLTSDCEAPLECRLARCRVECRDNRDCAAGLTCLLDNTGLGACQLPDETDCALDSDCIEPLVCVRGTCSNICREDRDCAPGASCLVDDDAEPSTSCPVGGEPPADGCACFDPATDGCLYAADCGPGLLCANDFRCRPGCGADADCRDGLACVARDFGGDGCIPVCDLPSSVAECAP